MGTSITFDTLEFAQTLVDAGFSDIQAKAITKSQKAAIQASIDTQLATKVDVLNLEKSLKDEINIVKSDITLLKYMNGIIIGILIALSMKFIFN